MCGIAGFVDPNHSFSQERATGIAELMVKALEHRGPDDSGLWVDVNRGVYLGHRRLSVIDLTTAGHQPMESAGGRYVLAFNGEIYNHRRLRQLFERSGHRFRGTSDTEVLLTAVEEWGLFRALPRLSGMFALALVDRTADTLYLARDRAGKKPLYYGSAGDHFLFGSETPAFYPHPRFAGGIDRDVLALYFERGYIPAPSALYQGIRKVRAGTVVEVPLTTPSAPKETIYWSPAQAMAAAEASPFEGTLVDATDVLEDTLRSAVRDRLISDVPIGAFLSGGADSSLVTALTQAESSGPVRTFNVTLDNELHDESDPASAASAWLGTEHRELPVTPSSLVEAISCLSVCAAEPIGDPAALSTYLVAHLARGDVTVVLTGEGADELFAGYERYWQGDRVWRWVRRGPVSLRVPVARRLLVGAKTPTISRLAEILACPDIDALHWRMTRHWGGNVVLGGSVPAWADGPRAPGGPPQDPLARMRLLDVMTSLPDGLLFKVDQATMAASVEARVPFLDEHVMELAMRMPPEFLVRGSSGKHVVREVLRRYLPPEVAGRPKKGFGLPLEKWLRGPLREWAEDLLSPARISARGYLDEAIVRKSWTGHLAGDHTDEFRLWDVLMFEAWLDSQSQRRNSAATK